MSDIKARNYLQEKSQTVAPHQKNDQKRVPRRQEKNSRNFIRS